MTRGITNDDQNYQSSAVVTDASGQEHPNEAEKYIDLATADDNNDKRKSDNSSSPEEINKREPPPLPQYEKLAQKNPKLTDHLSMTIGPPIIILFDIVVPCIIYYAWYNSRRSQWVNDCRPYIDQSMTCPIEFLEFNENILGYAIVSFGFGELYILIARVYRLLRQTNQCAPLLSRTRWELDATSWVYGVSMICALIPFVISSARGLPILYLYSPAFLMGFLGILMLITLIPFKIPIGINSHARGTPLRPFIYYAAEDFIAVDGLQDREFRIRYNERYNSSKSFRRMFTVLTIWWIFGVCVYLGCLSAVIWTLEFHYAFGLSLGVLFAYIIIWATISFWWVQMKMTQERKAYNLQL